MKRARTASVRHGCISLPGVLDAPIVLFFEGVDSDYRNHEIEKLMHDPEILRFVRAYYRITDTQARLRLRRLTSVLAGVKL